LLLEKADETTKAKRRIEHAKEGAGVSVLKELSEAERQHQIEIENRKPNPSSCGLRRMATGKVQESGEIPPSASGGSLLSMAIDAAVRNIRLEGRRCIAT
jgi:hypothetical protein